MKLLWLALATVILAGCAVVPVPVPYGYASPGVSVGVPVYRGGYRRYPYRGYPYRHGHGYWH